MKGILNKISEIKFSVGCMVCDAVMQTILNSMIIKNIDKIGLHKTSNFYKKQKNGK